MTAILINDMQQGGAQKTLYRLLQVFPKPLPIILLLKKDKHGLIPPEYEIILIKSPLGFFGLPFKLKKIIKKKQISLVLSQLYRSNFINIMARILGAPHTVMVMNHGMASRLYGEGIKGRINLFLQRHLYPKAHSVICVSQGMAADLMRIAPRIKAISVIPNPFPVKKLENQAQLEKEQFTKPEFHIVCIGRLIALKNYSACIRAAAALKNIPFNMDIYGEGQKHTELAQLIAKYKMHTQIHLPGYIENPMPLLAAADVLLSLSKTEGLPTIIIEAMIAGTIIISTDCPSGPREILAPESHHSNMLQKGMEITPFGILVATGDEKAATEALQWVYHNPQKVDEIRKRARVRAETWDVKNILPLYTKILLPHSNAHSNYSKARIMTKP